MFFKPTLLYKEYMILDMIEKNKNITQREMSKEIGVAVSMINDYLDEYEKKGLIKRKKHSTKTVEYFVSKKGMERRKLLNIWYLKSSHEVYLSAKDNIIKFINQIIQKGFKKILLYGAGEVAEIMLKVIDEDNLPLIVLSVIDDDSNKENTTIYKSKIVSPLKIDLFQYDGILISSYKHQKSIKYNLMNATISESKIITFFAD